jgi:hypothetical protein
MDSLRTATTFVVRPNHPNHYLAATRSPILKTMPHIDELRTVVCLLEQRVHGLRRTELRRTGLRAPQLHEPELHETFSPEETGWLAAEHAPSDPAVYEPEGRQAIVSLYEEAIQAAERDLLLLKR